MKVLFDTNILINKAKESTCSNNPFTERATNIIEKCDELNWIKCISERTLREFEKGWRKPNFPKNIFKHEKLLLDKFILLPYHFGNETWENIVGTWGNIGSKWNNKIEFKVAKEIQAELPSKNEKADRGILLDAIYNKCKMVISENFKDFNKLKIVGEKYNVIVCVAKDFDKEYLKYI